MIGALKKFLKKPWVGAVLGVVVGSICGFFVVDSMATMIVAANKKPVVNDYEDMGRFIAVTRDAFVAEKATIMHPREYPRIIPTPSKVLYSKKSRSIKVVPID